MKKDKKGLEKSTFMEIPAIMRSVTALAFEIKCKSPLLFPFYSRNRNAKWNLKVQSLVPAHFRLSP